MILYPYLRLDDDLEDIGELSPADGNFIVGSAAGWVVESGNTVLTSLGLGPGNSPTFTNIDLTDITDGYVPFIGAAGTVESSIYTDGTSIGIGTTLLTKIVNISHSTSYEPRIWMNCTATPDGSTHGASVDVGLFSGDTGKYVTTGDVLGKFNFTGQANNAIFTGGEFRCVVETGGDLPRGSMVTGLALRSKPSGVNGASGSNSDIYISGAGNVGFGGEEDPATLSEWTHTEPYLTLHNSTHEDTDGRRESRLIARGEQSGGEESVLGYEEFAHDGGSDDEKGLWRVLLNDGNDGTLPSIVGIKIDSAGDIYAGSTKISDNSGNLQSANGLASFNGAVTNLTVVNGIVTAAS